MLDAEPAGRDQHIDAEHMREVFEHKVRDKAAIVDGLGPDYRIQMTLVDAGRAENLGVRIRAEVTPRRKRLDLPPIRAAESYSRNPRPSRHVASSATFLTTSWCPAAGDERTAAILR